LSRGGWRWVAARSAPPTGARGGWRLVAAKAARTGAWVGAELLAGRARAGCCLRALRLDSFRVLRGYGVAWLPRDAAVAAGQAAAGVRRGLCERRIGDSSRCARKAGSLGIVKRRLA
jgi:hypothetical protein